MTKITYRLAESFVGDDYREVDYPTMKLARKALAERIEDLLADDYVVLRVHDTGATFTHPDADYAGQVAARLFIEEVRPLRTVDITGMSREDFERLLDTSTAEIEDGDYDWSPNSYVHGVRDYQ